MSREIKFRGMDIDGRWFYGNLAILTENVRHLKQGHYISNSIGLPFAYQVRPETVGQLTGLKDKNGKEVYEGDVIRHIPTAFNTQKCEGEVFWFNGHARFALRGVQHYLDSLNTYEVISNIYEHQELLEG